MPRVVSDPNELRGIVTQWRRSGWRIGLVPTMGALHEGHLSLVRAARASCDVTAVSIFVNPTQFAPHEDFGKYPRTFDDDLRMLTAERVDLVFAPSADAMYPAGASTFVDPPAVARRWEGAIRPGHFRGVATVVLQLLHLLPAEVAFFGQKDYQQCRVVQQMVADLHVATEICVCPIVREPDGLAMSSRNRYLSDADRPRALGLYRALVAVREQYDAGTREARLLTDAMRAALLAAHVDQIDYAVVVDRHSLDELAVMDRPAVAIVAARVGGTRLIDNEVLGSPTGASNG